MFVYLIGVCVSRGGARSVAETGAVVEMELVAVSLCVCIRACVVCVCVCVCVRV